MRILIFGKKAFKKFREWPAFSALIMVTLFFLINCFVTRNFLTFDYLISLFGNNTPLILISLGVAVVILGGGIDISQGSLITVLNVFFVTITVSSGLDYRLSAVLMLLMGAVIGAINGIVVSLCKVPALLATFSMTFILDGISYWIMPSPMSGMPKELVSWYHGSILGVPTPIVILFISIVMCLFIKRTPIMTWILSVGNSRENAFVSGIPVCITQIFSYMFAGLMGAIAAFSMTANTGSADALLAQGMSLQAVSACVIGGLSMNGGRGSLSGAVLGAIYLFLTSTIVYSLKVDVFYQDLIEAVIILAGVICSVLISRILAKEVKEV